ncbi:hypothetical protein ACQB6R_07805 [Propionibacteriaceae bacterium G1746]|uniref:hypothetical protein n=1 Tax=Aestuariimicrobium sp. G57 TaxID=3418485 RepID=UPI003C291AF5
MSTLTQRMRIVVLAAGMVAGMAACSQAREALPDPSSTTFVRPDPTPSQRPNTAPPTTRHATSPSLVTTSTVVPRATAWVTRTADSAPSSPNAEPTLPPPSFNPTPAATSGPLHLDSQPRPPGWAPTPAHAPTATRARDPRYAAWEAMMVGCAAVDRRTWTDPAHALEIAVTSQGRPGVGLVMQFGSTAAARSYHAAFTAQLRACTARADAGRPQASAIDDSPMLWLGRRTYADGSRWVEVASVNGATVRLWVLRDDGAMDEDQMRHLAGVLAA